MSTTAASSADRQPRIAVIGAGAAGLAAARVLSREGYDPVVLEKDPLPGGVWRYIVDSETRPMYRGLRTNLPKEVMAFREFPFSSKIPASFVTHQQVQEYLLEYQTHFGLEQYIHYDCEVLSLRRLQASPSRLSPPTESWPTFQLDWKDKKSKGNEIQTVDFDAVLVCNGHYAVPSFPNLPGLNEYFRGTVQHSIAYDDPTLYKDQTVLCVGGRASGADLAREMSPHAKHVYLSDTTCTEVEEDGCVTLVPKTVEVTSDGTVLFDLGCPIRPKVDTIIFCSGYDYYFPFLDQDDSNLELHAIPGERRVMPLYEQLWHAQHPSITFVGLPHSVVPFPLFELQAEAVCGQWNKDGGLLPVSKRMDAAQRDAVQGGAKKNGRVQDTHYLGSAQWDYCRRISKLAGNCNERMESYLVASEGIYNHAGAARGAGSPGGPDSYRSIVYERDWGHWKVVQEANELITDAK